MSLNKARFDFLIVESNTAHRQTQEDLIATQEGKLSDYEQSIGSMQRTVSISVFSNLKQVY